MFIYKYTKKKKSNCFGKQFAEGVGFEPTRRYSRPNGLASRPLIATWVPFQNLVPLLGLEPRTDRI